MRLHSVTEKCHVGQKFTLYPLGDVHLGSANCDTDLLFDTVATIRKDPDARWIGLGDYVEAITPTDKRWHAGGIDENVVNFASQDRICDVYVDKFASIVEPIMDKCWAMGDGNHEDKANALYFTNLVVRMLERVGRPELYTGWDAITRVVFEVHGTQHLPLRVYHMHGWQAGRKAGAKINGLDDLMGYIDGCRIYLVGHSHSKLIVSKTKLSTNQQFTRLVADDAFGAHCGSFMRTYQQDVTGYGERKSYPPASLGPPSFTITPYVHQHGTTKEAGLTVRAIQ